MEGIRPGGRVAGPLAGILLLALVVGSAPAQEARPPWQGGLTRSLGQPSLYRPFAAATAGFHGTGEDRIAGGRMFFGVRRPVTHPVIGLLGLNAESYVGLRNTRPEGGGRLLVASPFFRVAAGLDLNLRDVKMDAILSSEVPLRRGGIVGSGTRLRLDWIPARAQIEVGLSVPLHSNAGRTRPLRDHVPLRAPAPQWIGAAGLDPEIVRTLDGLRASARRIDLLTTPKIEQGPSNPADGIRVLAGQIRSALPPAQAGLSPAETEVGRFHGLLDEAFRLAAGGAGGDSRVAGLAREVLLEHVLLPYNRLLGQRRSDDNLNRFQAVAWAGFVRGLGESGISPSRWPALVAVFESLLETAEQVRAAARDRWGDGRLVWLPLQLALRPDEHATQADLDRLIERAVARPFTGGNRVAYIVNDQFQVELARTVRLARDYHVLWIHDFAGVNPSGRPDSVAAEAVVAYLDALADRARDYDRAGRMPVFLLFLDQFYYEQNRSRLWLDLLERPLDHEVLLPRGSEALGRRLTEARERLRAAVARSTLLQLEARQYGPAWLRNQIRVHVNVTNPADRSFNSNQILPLYGLPDDVMRDHRKLAFYDVMPDDPGRGEAIFTGMGIGDHYVGPTWEDRALLVEGPSNVGLREAARRLLRVHGFTEDELPWPLRPAPSAEAPPPRAPARPPDRGAARALVLHNETGYGPKEISVARATLYTLMPRGSVMMVPGSLWGNQLAGSMLLGSALRGGRVLVMAPSRASAPSAGWPAMTRAWELLVRLVLLGGALGPELQAADGQIRVGFYDPRSPVTDLRGRYGVFAGAERRTPWLDTLLNFHPAVDSAVASVDSLLAAAGFPPEGAADPESGPALRPRLHLKGDLFVTREGWDRLLGRPGLATMFRTFAVQQARTLDRAGDSASDARDRAAEMARVTGPVVQGMLNELSPAERTRVAYYLMVGSANQDSRSFMLDGEAGVLVSGPEALQGLLDFIVLTGLCTWIDRPEELEPLLPAPTWLRRLLARWIRTIV